MKASEWKNLTKRQPRSRRAPGTRGGSRALAAARYAATSHAAMGAINDDLHAEMVERLIRSALDDGRVPTHVRIRALVNLTAEFEIDQAEGVDPFADEVSTGVKAGRKRRQR
jgi:hypothetical protein